MASADGENNGFTVEQFGEFLSYQAAEVISSARVVFKHNADTFSQMTSQINELQEENAELRAKLKTTLSNQKVITELQKENTDLRAKLEIALAHQEVYDKGQELVRETMVKFTNVFGAWSPSNTPEMEPVVPNVAEVLDNGDLQLRDCSTTKGRKTEEREGDTPRGRKRRPHPNSDGTSRSARARSRLASFSDSQSVCPVSGQGAN